MTEPILMTANQAALSLAEGGNATVYRADDPAIVRALAIAAYVDKTIAWREAQGEPCGDLRNVVHFAEAGLSVNSLRPGESQIITPGDDDDAVAEARRHINLLIGNTGGREQERTIECMRSLIARIEDLEAMCAAYADTIGECNAENSRLEVKLAEGSR